MTLISELARARLSKVTCNAEPAVVLRVQTGLTRQWPYFLVLVWLPALYMALLPPKITTPTLPADQQPILRRRIEVLGHLE
jgi:hypothetical protein